MIEKAYSCPSTLVEGIFKEVNEYRGCTEGKPFSRMETKTVEVLVEFLLETEMCGVYEPRGVIDELEKDDSPLQTAFFKLMDLR